MSKDFKEQLGISAEELGMKVIPKITEPEIQTPAKREISLNDKIYLKAGG